MNEIISSFEERLKTYKIELDKSPHSIFYQGLVKNTEEYINELKLKNKQNENSDNR